jgi:FAD/FMN-containing dehydrogenase
MTTHVDELRNALQGVLDVPGFLAGDDVGMRYRQDWRGMEGEPVAVLRPATPEAVAATMRVLHARRQKVVVQGGMTGLVNGAVAAPGEVVLSLERLNRIETRLSVIEQTVGGIFAMMGSDREALQSLARRVERIEHRLELTDNH